MSRALAWAFWTNVSNWKLDADVEAIEIDGQFATGARGITFSRGSGRIEWRIADVSPEQSALIEFPLPGAVGRFHWIFEDLGPSTRITQRVTLEGEQVSTYVGPITDSLARGIPLGMQKLCEAMTR